MLLICKDIELLGGVADEVTDLSVHPITRADEVTDLPVHPKVLVLHL